MPSIPKRTILRHGSEQKLQRNILAKLIVDEKEVTLSLIDKRKEFEKRINKCKEKQIKLGIKQEESVKSINRYSQFINEKEIIRKKSIIKFQTELKMRLQKMLEYEILTKELQTVAARHERISLKVTQNKKFKDFLAKAIAMLPDSKYWSHFVQNYVITLLIVKLLDYLEAGDSKYISLMLRHQTLFESNYDLFENLIANSDKVNFELKI